MSAVFQTNNLHLAVKIALFGMIATVAINPAMAEETMPQTTFDEIVVTASTNTNLAPTAILGSLGDKSIVDTPFTVTNYTNSLIKNQQADTVAEVLRNDPSIRTTTNQGHLNENFTLRGFTYNWEDYNLNGSYGVAPISRIPTDIIDSVTVVKGPTALVTGMSPLGAVGGVIIANTKRADKDMTQLSASVEKGGYYKSGFDIAKRMGNNRQFGVRVSGDYGRGEHIIHNMEDENKNALLALDYTTDKAKINLDSYVIRDDRNNGSPAMVSMAGIKKVIEAPKGDTNLFTQLEGKTESQYAGLSGEYKFTPNTKVYAGAGYTDKSYKGHIFGTRMILTNDKGDATSQYYRVDSTENNTSANAGIETRFNTDTITHTLGLRADYVNRKYDQHANPTVSNFKTNLYNPSKNGEMPATAPKAVPYFDGDFTSYTLTDQIGLLNNKLDVILGARYQDMDIDNVYQKTKYSQSKTSPSLGIVYRPYGDNLSFYGSYVEGLSAGSTINNVKDANNGKTFEPYTTKQYEIGTKFQNKDWLHTLAIYQIERPTLAVDTTYRDANNKNITQISTEGGKTRNRGVEWGFSGVVTPQLNVLGNLAYIDSEVTKSPPTANPALNLKGKQVVGLPKFTGSLGLDYAVPQVNGLNLTTRASYISKQYLNGINTLELPNYTLWDVGARYKTRLGGVNTTFLANVENMGDKKYWEGVFNDGYATIGAGRNYKLGVSFDF